MYIHSIVLLALYPAIYGIELENDKSIIYDKKNKKK